MTVDSEVIPADCSTLRVVHSLRAIFKEAEKGQKTAPRTVLDGKNWVTAVRSISTGNQEQSRKEICITCILRIAASSKAPESDVIVTYSPKICALSVLHIPRKTDRTCRKMIENGSRKKKNTQIRTVVDSLKTAVAANMKLQTQNSVFT